MLASSSTTRSLAGRAPLAVALITSPQRTPAGSTPCLARVNLLQNVLVAGGERRSSSLGTRSPDPSLRRRCRESVLTEPCRAPEPALMGPPLRWNGGPAGGSG